MRFPTTSCPYCLRASPPAPAAADDGALPAVVVAGEGVAAAADAAAATEPWEEEEGAEAGAGAAACVDDSQPLRAKKEKREAWPLPGGPAGVLAGAMVVGRTWLCVHVVCGVVVGRGE